MSIGSSKSSSKSKTTLYGPDKLMLQQQKDMWGTQAPSVVERAMQGGYSPGEKGAMFARMVDPINASFRTGMEDLRGEFARSGLAGGAAGSDMKGLFGAKMAAIGGAAGSIEEMSRDENARRRAELLSLMTWHAPALTGQSSTSSGKSMQFGIG